MKYMLITVIEREILTERFETYDDAKSAMLDEFWVYSDFDDYDFLKEEEYEADDGDYGFSKYGGWLNDGKDHYNYDWLIVAL